MIQKIPTAVLFIGGLLFIVFAFVEYALFSKRDDECKHPNKVTYDSVHKQVCIDCLTEFSTEGIKK